LYAKNVLQDSKLIYEEEVLTATQRLNEYIMTSLRTKWGLDLGKVEREWNSDLATEVEKASHLFQEKKWVMEEGRILKLTNAGKLYADKVAGEMFVSEVLKIRTH
jgi:oxygen-independent coproporphyrinogen-3 oxidase